MNIVNRVFAIPDDESIVKMSNTKLEKLLKFDKDTSFPEFKNKKIKIASLLITLKNRKPERIISENYYFYEFEKTGKLDKEKYNAQFQVKLALADSILSNTISEGKVTYTEKGELKENLSIQYQWIPSIELKRKLHDRIFK